MIPRIIKEKIRAIFRSFFQAEKWSSLVDKYELLFSDIIGRNNKIILYTKKLKNRKKSYFN
ncbi:hypothetical protein E5E95_02545 [Mesomycoplasma hyopneumoniae]|nr:hypothetical protein E5E95_02545 [Mesomycoplasma hyopneumoniae]